MQNMSNGPVQPASGARSKNKFSISDSAAFRKANHDAMEAVKATVSKLKAERERFFREEGNPRQTSPVDRNNIPGGTREQGHQLSNT